jgi:hypothetical protein
VKEVSRKLFSSEQASDGREAHRGSVSGSEHSWAVQAPPAAPAAVGDVWFGIIVCPILSVCTFRPRYSS